MFDAIVIGLPYGEKNYDDMLSRFHLIPERYGQTDRQKLLYINIASRVSVLTRNKNRIWPLLHYEDFVMLQSCTE